MLEAQAASGDGQADSNPGTEDTASGERPVKRKQVQGLPLWGEPWEMRPGEGVPSLLSSAWMCVSEPPQPAEHHSGQSMPGSRVNPR